MLVFIQVILRLREHLKASYNAICFSTELGKMQIWFGRQIFRAIFPEQSLCETLCCAENLVETEEMSHG